MKLILKLILKCLFRVEIHGMENYSNAQGRMLIIANHTSFLDALLLGVFLSKDIRFAVNTHIATRWYFKPFFKLVNIFAIDPTNPMALKSIIQSIKQGDKNMIFPEGRITTTGALMKVYGGPAMIADKADANILPIRIDGAQYSFFGRMPSKTKRHLFPKIKIHILPVTQLSLEETLRGHKRREKAGAQLYTIMINMIFTTSDYQQILPKTLIQQMKIYGANHPIIEDVMRKPLSYGKMLTASFVLGKKLHDPNTENVGFMLPNMTSSVIAFYGLQLYGNVSVMLNYSAGSKNLVAACETAKLRKVVTSKLFIKKGGLEDAIEQMQAIGVEIQYLEDIRETISWKDKVSGMASRYFPNTALKRINKKTADDAAIILFTSGSEGMPKGVVLSHANIQANRYQLASVIDFHSNDIVFNCMPIFHAFGLTGGMLLPVLSGVKTFFYPSPLHYRLVPELIYDTNATIVFGTDTFLNGYARYAHPYDFHTVRYIFSGAEKLRESTRQLYMNKYQVNVMEGYGATETAPVISLNTPMNQKYGSVGKLLPSMTMELEEIDGLSAGKKLVVSGPNIMKGYLFHDAPGELQPVENQRYDTGDIVNVDDAGFITICGRAKRFAKIAGEMVSLTAVEQCIQEVHPDFSHAAAQVPDAKKGEAIILFTTKKDLTRKEVIEIVRTKNLSELYIPKTIEVIEELPILGSGKIDFSKLSEMAKAIG